MASAQISFTISTIFAWTFVVEEGLDGLVELDADSLSREEGVVLGETPEDVNVTGGLLLMSLRGGVDMVGRLVAVAISTE